MGTVSTITHERFPKQSGYVGKNAIVLFGQDSSKKFKATVVRDDLEAPFRMILKLEDGRYVLSLECQYAFE